MPSSSKASRVTRHNLNTPIQGLALEAPQIHSLLLEKSETSRSWASQNLSPNSPIVRRQFQTEDGRSPYNHDHHMGRSIPSAPSPQRYSTDLSRMTPSRSSPQQAADHRRRQQEEEDSIALARMLMAQEAIESYALSTDYLRLNAGNYSQEDLDAFQALLTEDEGEGGEVPSDDYETLLRLGETIGDVKTDRWKMVAQQHIRMLPTFHFTNGMADGREENDTKRKCQVCQCDYENQDTIKALPCGHCFHSQCVDQWLKTNNCCAFCRKPVVN